MLSFYSNHLITLHYNPTAIAALSKTAASAKMGAFALTAIASAVAGGQSISQGLPETWVLILTHDLRVRILLVYLT